MGTGSTPPLAGIGPVFPTRVFAYPRSRTFRSVAAFCVVDQPSSAFVAALQLRVRFRQGAPSLCGHMSGTCNPPPLLSRIPSSSPLNALALCFPLSPEKVATTLFWMPLVHPHPSVSIPSQRCKIEPALVFWRATTPGHPPNAQESCAARSLWLWPSWPSVQRVAPKHLPRQPQRQPRNTIAVP